MIFRRTGNDVHIAGVYEGHWLRALRCLLPLFSEAKVKRSPPFVVHVRPLAGEQQPRPNSLILVVDLSVPQKY